MRKLLYLLVALVVLPALYLLFWPTGIDPVAWKPQPAPALEGKYAVNNKLAEVEWLARGAGHGPEDVDVDAQGRIYAGYHDGRILRFDANGENQELFADTEGRPLGLEFAADGTLVVADAIKGLLAVRQDGSIRVLSTEADGVPYKFTDDLDIASDGSIYFSDASSKWGYGEHMQDILEHGGHGRLIRYRPLAGTAEVLLDGLQFANGIAVAQDESFVLVNETGSNRVMRYWLEGEQAGTEEIFIDNLPGIPDGISTGEHAFWLALFSPRSPDLDRLAKKPFLRKLALRLPESLRPQPVRHAFVLGLDEDGEVIHNLQDPSPESYAPITSVEEAGEYLYFGSLTREAIARMPVPPPPAWLEIEYIEEDGGDDVEGDTEVEMPEPGPRVTEPTSEAAPEDTVDDPASNSASNPADDAAPAEPTPDNTSTDKKVAPTETSPAHEDAAGERPH